MDGGTRDFPLIKNLARRKTNGTAGLKRIIGMCDAIDDADNHIKIEMAQTANPNQIALSLDFHPCVNSPCCGFHLFETLLMERRSSSGKTQPDTVAV